MALADVLSAMREIILDAPNLPLDLKQREDFFENHFPGLSNDERIDLARIDPEKFSIYTTSIFQGEKGILENHFPITFELLKKHWAEAYKEKFIGRAIPQRLHAIRPWKSQSPMYFAQNFRDYLKADCAPLLAVRPDISAIASLEFSTYRLRRAPDIAPHLNFAHVVPVDKIEGLTVGELLLSALKLNPHIEFLELSYNVLPVREYFYANGRDIPQEIAVAQQTLLIGTRNERNAIYWLPVSAAVYEFMKEAAGAKRHSSVEDLGAAIADSLPEEAAETQIFELLVTQLAVLAAHEFVFVEKP